MNKTVLLACCDFLILATLSLSYVPKSITTEIPPKELPVSTEFHLDEATESEDQLLMLSTLYEQRLKELSAETNSTHEKLADKKAAFNDLNEEYLKLKSKYEVLLNKQNEAPRPASGEIAKSRIEIVVNMKEEDSFNPDSMRARHYTALARVNDQAHIIAHAKNLGLYWPELLEDGHISELRVIIAKPGDNAWSYRATTDIKSLREVPGICLIPLASTVKSTALPLLTENPEEHLKRLKVLKADGRIIQVQQATSLPSDSEVIEISEKRFLGQPDNIATGDLVLTNNGQILGMVTATKIEGNTRRHITHILAKIDTTNYAKIPLLKKKEDKYFVDFVEAVKKTFQ